METGARFNGLRRPSEPSAASSTNNVASAVTAPKSVGESPSIARAHKAPSTVSSAVLSVDPPAISLGPTRRSRLVKSTYSTVVAMITPTTPLQVMPMCCQIAWVLTSSPVRFDRP